MHATGTGNGKSSRKRMMVLFGLAAGLMGAGCDTNNFGEQPGTEILKVRRCVQAQFGSNGFNIYSAGRVKSSDRKGSVIGSYRKDGVLSNIRIEYDAKGDPSLFFRGARGREKPVQGNTGHPPIDTLMNFIRENCSMKSTAKNHG